MLPLESYYWRCALGRIQSWEVSDALWEKVEPLVPRPCRDPNREYSRGLGGGRKPLPYRRVFEGIVYVLRTGCQWKALPKERFGCPSAVHRYFLQWAEAGFFRALWQVGLMDYDELHGIVWEWQSIDGAMTKAPLAQESVGANPTDRGKKRDQASHPGGCQRHPARRRRHRSQPS